jgi:hypothetical protein
VSVSLYQVSNVAEHSGTIGQWSTRSYGFGGNALLAKSYVVNEEGRNMRVEPPTCSQSVLSLERSVAGGLQLVEVDSTVVIFHGIRLRHALLVSRQVCVVESVANRSPLPELVLSLDG